MNIFALSVTVFLAGVIGFSAHRASLCSVRAVEEVLTTRRAYMLSSFIKTAMWVIGATLITLWAIPDNVVTATGWRLSATTLYGGFIFGVGATINGGCAFSTLTRLGSGNIGMIVSLVGFTIGAGCYGMIATTGMLGTLGEAPAHLITDGDWRPLATVVFAIWMVWELLRLFRSSGSSGLRDRVLASRYRLSTAALLMGLSNAVLYVVIGTWTYTQLLGQTARHALTDSQPAPIFLWVLFCALVFGVALSARQSSGFRWRWKPQWRWAGFGVGGILMGFGAAMIPGGNDALILHGIPSLSPHALPAFLSMLIGIGVSLASLRVVGGKIPHIDCGGDICVISSDE